jgi:hypothetical protein
MLLKLDITQVFECPAGNSAYVLAGAFAQLPEECLFLAL